MQDTYLIKRLKQLTPVVYIGWFSVACFYFYQYILRVAPGVLVTDLRQTFHLTAEQFSTLGAFYLYAYALCQIPLGVIVDYVGVRKTVLVSIVLCLLGSLLLAFSNTLFLLQVSRVLVGLGSASAFMCALKVVVDYLPSGKRGFLMGATLTLGTCGALVAGKPLALLTDAFGWREAIAGTTFIGVCILFFAYLYLPEPKPETLFKPHQHAMGNIMMRIIGVFKLKYVMLYALLAVGVYTPLSVLADLWGVAFLMQKYQLSRLDAASTSMMMYVGLGIGCLLLPWLSEKYHVLNRSIMFCTIGVFLIFALLLYGPLLSLWMLKGCLILLGVCCGVEMLCFTGASQYTLSHNVGTTLGIVNTLNMLGGGILQQVIGSVLDTVWSGKYDLQGVRVYDAYEYQLALSVLFGVVVICCLLCYCLPRDRQTTE